MKGVIRWTLLVVAVALIAGCAEKQPPILELIRLTVEGKHDEVITLAEKMTSKNPNDTQAHRFLVRAALEKGQLDKYVRKYQELVQAQPTTPGYHFALGYSYTQTKEYDAALKELQKAIELSPSIEYAHYVIGWIHLNSEYADAKPAEGLAAWDKEEQLDPKSLGALQVYADRANYYLRVGDADSAEKDFEKITLYAFAPEDITGARDRIAEIRALRDELARRQADVQDNPEDADARYKLGVVQYKSGNVDEAIVTWQRAADLAPESTAVRNSLGKALLEKERFKEAAEEFRRVVELDPQSETACYNLAVAEEFLGNIDQALEYYKKYLEINPASSRLEEVKQRISALEEQKAAKKG
jgi:tetratricopeptide (TPR) repeat protein